MAELMKSHLSFNRQWAFTFTVSIHPMLNLSGMNSHSVFRSLKQRFYEPLMLLYQAINSY